MDKIEVKVLNPDVVLDAEKMMVTMARLTQRGHTIQDMDDFDKLLDMDYSDSFVDTLVDLPHPTLQKFGVINVMVIGASRRFLAQITRHQNEVKFMSGSLQYSDYSDKAQFVVPYEMLEAGPCNIEINNPAVPGTTASVNLSCRDVYLKSCDNAMKAYRALAAEVGHDAAGFAAPQGLRNVLLISATPYQFKHMIRQRTCNRNSMETQYVMLLIWEQLYKISNMFENCGPYCISDGKCPEGKMSCRAPYMQGLKPEDILDDRFRLIRRKCE